MKVEAYIVYYKHLSSPAKAIFLQKERADNYAVQHHGVVKELICQEPVDLHSLPSSTTNAEASLPRAKTAT